MPPLLPRVGYLRHAAAFSLLGLFSSPAGSTRSMATQGVVCSRFLVRQPAPTAPTESPTPLVMLRAKGLTAEESEKWVAWAGMFSEKGYTAIEIDIDAAADKSMAPMVSELAFQIRTLAIPYPPLIFAQGASTLLSQSFISDHPASGLVLVDPISPLEGMSEFTYEPTFPILVLASEAKQEDLHKTFRLLTNFKGGPGRGGRGVSVEVARDVRSHEARTNVERWMDRCGY